MWLIPPWAAPLVFELLVLGATCWNAIDRPRSGDMPLRHVLHRDGITFFLVGSESELLVFLDSSIVRSWQYFGLPTWVSWPLKSHRLSC
jgi:hypothetical protein